MSLIMDALEKLQKEAQPPAAVAETPKKSALQPQTVRFEAEVLSGQGRFGSERVTNRSQTAAVVLFSAVLFAAALIGFGKISTGLAVPQPSAGFLAPVTETASRPAAVPQAGPGILRGILQDPAGSYCILGEQILKKGDTWRGYTVVSIEAQQVVVQDSQNRLLTLHLQEL